MKKFLTILNGHLKKPSGQQNKRVLPGSLVRVTASGHDFFREEKKFEGFTSLWGRTQDMEIQGVGSWFKAHKILWF